MYLKCCQSGGEKEFSVKDGTATVSRSLLQWYNVKERQDDNNSKRPNFRKEIKHRTQLVLCLGSRSWGRYSRRWGSTLTRTSVITSVTALSSTSTFTITTTTISCLEREEPS